jgi:GT2 family glycosyltransferase
MFAPLARGEGLHGYKWDSRTIERANIMIDDTIEFQGSCVFMTKEWFDKCGFMDLKYSGWGSEAEEVGLTTWKNGGRVVTNKNTYYAHLHKGKKYGRMYHLNQSERQKSWDYARNLWLNENKEFFISLIERFMPMPSWPENWEERIWKS